MKKTNFTASELMKIGDTLTTISYENLLAINAKIYETNIGLYPLKQSIHFPSVNISDVEIKKLLGCLSIMNEESIWALYKMIEFRTENFNLGIIPPPPDGGGNK